MPRSKAWQSTLFHYEQLRFQRIEHEADRGVEFPGIGFHVGIWWHDHKQLVAFLQSIGDIQAPGHLIDSELAHDLVWDTARLELSCPDETEYFDVPRGRILWDTVHQAGVVYHGNSTPAELFTLLTRIYRLPRWTARLDEHYLTGDALESFYNVD